MALDIKITKKKDYVYSVELKGSIDTDSYSRLEDELKEIIDDKTKAVVLDMAGVNYVSSAGIRTLLLLHRKAAPSGVLALAAPAGETRTILNVVGLAKAMRVFETLEEAVEALGGEANG